MIDLKTQVNEKVKNILVQLAKEAQTEFENAAYDGDKGNINVYCKMDNNGGELIADGYTVGFIEFGTGLTAKKGAGSFGKGQGANPNGWAYIGEPGTNGRRIRGKPNIIRTKGNPPAGIMDKAVTRIIQELK